MAGRKAASYVALLLAMVALDAALTHATTRNFVRLLLTRVAPHLAQQRPLPKCKLNPMSNLMACVRNETYGNTRTVLVSSSVERSYDISQNRSVHKVLPLS